MKVGEDLRLEKIWSSPSQFYLFELGQLISAPVFMSEKTRLT